MNSAFRRKIALSSAVGLLEGFRESVVHLMNAVKSKDISPDDAAVKIKSLVDKVIGEIQKAEDNK